MTRIEFFFNVEDKLQKIVELSLNAVSKGRRLFLFTPDATAAERLEHFLWTHPATGFLPNCRAESVLAGQTSLIVGWHTEPLPHNDILVNLQNQYPPFFSRFRRLIELVGLDETDKKQARDRYRFYRDRGYEIRTFDANGTTL